MNTLLNRYNSIKTFRSWTVANKILLHCSEFTEQIEDANDKKKSRLCFVLVLKLRNLLNTKKESVYLACMQAKILS